MSTMNKDPSPPQYQAVSPVDTFPKTAAVPPMSPEVVMQPVAQPTNPEAQIGHNYQLELMARCARGDHQVTKKYGVVGIICSVACFPFGMLALLCDVKKKCDRCGIIIE